jgi:hypothetical protein
MARGRTCLGIEKGFQFTAGHVIGFTPHSAKNAAANTTEPPRRGVGGVGLGVPPPVQAPSTMAQAIATCTALECQPRPIASQSLTDGTYRSFMLKNIPYGVEL